MIYVKKASLDESENSTFYEKGFNSSKCLTYYVLLLFLLFEYKMVCKFCVIDEQKSYYYFFLTGFSISWFPFSSCWLYW